jgi:hypothetical protein
MRAVAIFKLVQPLDQLEESARVLHLLGPPTLHFFVADDSWYWRSSSEASSHDLRKRGPTNGTAAAPAGELGGASRRRKEKWSGADK